MRGTHGEHGGLGLWGTDPPAESRGRAPGQVQINCKVVSIEMYKSGILVLSGSFLELKKTTVTAVITVRFKPSICSNS